MEDLVTSCARALEALWQAAERLEESIDRAMLERAVSRGLFRPSEDEALVGWFARLLSVREGLWEVIADASAPMDGDVDRVLTHENWQCLVLAYSAACLVVRLDRLLVDDVAHDRRVRRKLDEGSASHRIPRKEFTAIFESLSNPRQALAMLDAMRWVDDHASDWERLSGDPKVGFAARERAALETSLDPSRRRYLRIVGRYALHSLRRRGGSGRAKTTFTLLEAGGRFASEIYDRWRPRRIDGPTLARISELLQPGDVLVTRRDRAFTNLFLPGYWPHAALYVGPAEGRGELGITLDAERERAWSGERVVLEALKDGVRFRPLEETLAVDAVAILRPRLDTPAIARALERAAEHEGKAYNFDFDFFRADRLVCTEVVYRAYDGVDGLRFELKERAGRPTLSAEDLLDLGLDGKGFEVVAVYGAPDCAEELALGPAAHAPLAASYRGSTSAEAPEDHEMS